jgi:hypothetical protein
MREEERVDQDGERERDQVISRMSPRGKIGGCHMQRSLLWAGSVLCSIGAAVIVVSAVFGYFGLGTSYNFGNPAKFEFVLVPFWQIGLAITALGGAVLLIGRRLKAK